MVRPGIEVLLSDSLHLISGLRIGLLTNQTGVDRHGVADLDRLLAAGAQVTAIFAPEHGYRGFLDEAIIDHGLDSSTGIRIWSLYGEVRAPTPEMLEPLDAVVIDLQDMGARPYTYISTALLTMQAAAKHGVRVILLDRPNPIGGVLVQGPVLDTAFSSFVGMLPVAMRHGMTMGELALMGNRVLGLQADLVVVPAAGWRRTLWLDQTGLPWVRPSPNMPDLESAAHYPGTVLFEGTNLSVGRGTPVAFQVVGAPWLSPREVIARMGTLPGVSVSDTVIVPRAPGDGKYDGVQLPSVRLRVADRRIYDPVRAAVALLVAVREVHRDSLKIDAGRFDRLAGGSGLRGAVESGLGAGEIAALWEQELASFRRLREQFLLYR
ncbi:MAG: hypothetical protein KatS3mg081_2814 [Gemmatimonadales bacterium]|nr:MAG: hypothetical protein KatS3mg081_2814 [Gemmatimonadales bacterium]